MNLIKATLSLFLITGVASADVYVRGYTRSNGTYVDSHSRSDPNNSRTDNWSSKGNYNPYTGRKGTKNVDPYGSYSSYGDSNYNKKQGSGYRNRRY